MWKPCVCKVSLPLYVSVRYLQNLSFWLAEYGLGYSVWFLDIFSCLVWSVALRKDVINVMFGALGSISDKKIYMCMQIVPNLEEC